jgi:transposase
MRIDWAARRAGAERDPHVWNNDDAAGEQLRDWLGQVGCTHVGMESTGVYWVPVYAVLEEHCELIVGNAAHIKNVPGRKTDVKDAQWIAELIRCGLIRKSFVPPKWQRGASRFNTLSTQASVAS